MRKWFWKQDKTLRFNNALLGITILITTSLLSACGEQAARSTPDWFLAPTIVPKSSPIVIATPTEPLPSPTPDCLNDLEFVTDTTVPDGTAYPPDASIDKRWLVKNTGTCNWDQRYRVRFLDGDLMGAITEIALFPALSGTEAEIQIVFTTPPIGGDYSGTWQAFAPNGEAFGHWFSISIEVDPNLAPTASPGDDGSGDGRPDTGADE